MASFVTAAKFDMAWGRLCEAAEAKKSEASGVSQPKGVTPEGVTVEPPSNSTIFKKEIDGVKGKGSGVSGEFESEVKWASDYHKHKPPKGVDWKDIVKATTHGRAKYKSGIDIKKLELHAWKYGQKTTNGKNWKVFKSDNIIGANSGKETCYIRVECSANTVHGHPILESSYRKYLKK